MAKAPFIQPPMTSLTVNVLAPAAGAQLQVGQAFLIQWVTLGQALSHDVRISLDGGMTFNGIATGLPGVAQSFSFTPTAVSSQAIVRVAATSTTGNSARGDSPLFTIGQMTATVTVAVTRPAAGSVLAAGQSFAVQWLTLPAGAAFSHVVRFSSDGGATFMNISGDLPGNAQTFVWTVPNTATTNGLVRVVAKDMAGNQLAKGDSGGFAISASVQPAPAIDSINPAAGQEEDNTRVTIKGANYFATGANLPQVLFGGQPATSITLVDANTLQASTPARTTPDLVDIKVVNPDGQAAVMTAAFQYEGAPQLIAVFPPEGPAQPPDPTNLQKVTLQGRFLHANSDVFFGANKSPEVTFAGGNLEVRVPPATGPGPVTVKVQDRTNGKTAKLDNAFNYLGAQQASRARVFSVEPLSIIENTPSEIKIHGRNLMDAFQNHLLGFRVPSRAKVKRLTPIVDTPDPDGQFETLTFQVKVTANPALDFSERLLVQIVASRRPKDHVLKDKLVETSSVTLTVLAKDVPVPIAFNAKLTQGGTNLLVVAGANMSRATLDLDSTAGDAVALTYQKSDDRVAGALVYVDANASGSVALRVRDKTSGKVIARYPLKLSAAPPPASNAPGGEQNLPDPGLDLTQAPDQKLLAPTNADSLIFDLASTDPGGFPGTPDFTSEFLDLTDIKVELFDIHISIPILDEVRLFPLFDRGGDQLVDVPINAKVGRVFGVRGIALLLVLRVSLEIDISVALFIGVVDPFTDFPSSDSFNEFPPELEPLPSGDNVFGSLVVSFSVSVNAALSVLFLAALVQPDGTLRILASFQLNLAIVAGTKLMLGPGIYVRVQLGPKKITPLPIRPVYGSNLLQITNPAHPNGRFDDPQNIGFFGYYFARAEKRYCLDWDFDLQLIQGVVGGFEAPPLQSEFQPPICFLVNKPAQSRVLTIDPAQIQLNPPAAGKDGTTLTVRALAQAVDANGKPIGSATALRNDQVVFAAENPATAAFVVKKTPDPSNPSGFVWQVTGKMLGNAPLDVYPIDRGPGTASSIPSLPTPLTFTFATPSGVPANSAGRATVNVVPPAATAAKLPAPANPNAYEFQLKGEHR